MGRRAAPGAAHGEQRVCGDQRERCLSRSPVCQRRPAVSTRGRICMVLKWRLTLAENVMLKGSDVPKAKRATTSAKSIGPAKAPDVAPSKPERVTIPIEQATPVNAPTFYASAIQLGWGANDATLVFSRSVPLGSPEHPPGAIATLTPVVVLQLSAQTIKDLSVLLSRSVAVYEKEWGTIETEFTRDKK